MDLDQKQSAAQQKLVKKYFRGYIPHVTILDKSGKALYDDAGEVEESKLSTLLDQAIK